MSFLDIKTGCNGLGGRSVSSGLDRVPTGGNYQVREVLGGERVGWGYWVTEPDGPVRSVSVVTGP